MRHAVWLSAAVLSFVAAAESQPEPIQLTAQEDHRRMLDVLRIQSLRRGRDADPRSPNAANFDESKVAADIQLPPLLVLANGKTVATREQWWQQRRPELIELFDREIYGRLPASMPNVAWRVLSATQETRGTVPVVTKKLAGRVDNSPIPL